MTRNFLLLIAGLLMFNYAAAQLCNGSLGDAVVNITFGSGSNPGPPLSAATTKYQYVSNPCPVNGFYTVLHSGIECNYGWHVLQKDHTGDDNGYFMLVDASFEASDFYIDTVKGLCPNTTYEFAAWMLNMKKIQQGIRPNITFKIETISGQVLQSYNSGDIPPEDVEMWRQYGFFFTTSATAADIVLRMTNNAPGGDGNDLALDDITFRPCGPQISVSINGSLNKKVVCEGDTSVVTFTSTIVGGYNSPFYQWQKSKDSINWSDIQGATDDVYQMAAAPNPGNYFFRLSVAQGNNIFSSSCRVESAPAMLTIEALPIPGAFNNGPVCEGKSITLTANNGNTYSWAGPENYVSNSQSPVIISALSSDGKYYVTVTSANGCIGNDSTAIVINRNPSPNAGSDVNICEGAGTVLQGTVTNAASWSWSPAQGLSNTTSLTPLASPDKTTLYIFTANNGVCINADSVLINVIAQPTANAGPDKVIIGNQFATLEGEASGTNISFYWTPDIFLFRDSVLNPQASPPFNEAYILHVVSNDGCGEAADTVLVKYYKEIYIPNAYTPNNDGINDLWKIPALTAFPLAEVSVYNRFGQLIFYNKGYTKQWDGTFKGMRQPAGMYCYTVDLKNGAALLSGILILIR